MRTKLMQFSSMYGARVLLLLVVMGMVALASDPAAAKVTCPENVNC